MKKLTPEQFKKMYGDTALDGFTTITPTENQDYLSRVKSQVQGNLTEALQSQKDSGEGKMNPFAAGANIFKNVTGAVMSPLAQAPGFKQLGEGFSKAGQYLVDTELGNKVTDVLAENVPQETLGTVSDTIEGGLNVIGAYGTAKTAGNVLSKAKSAISEIKNPIPDIGGPQATKIATDTMNRVARLKPTDATAFKKLAGETHGEYLTKTKNFGAPDKIVANEAVKFTESIRAVDSQLAQLPGRYQSVPILESLRGLVGKIKKTSSGSVKPPYTKTVVELVNKYKSGGLTMKEINILKRLYERNVKLGYNKMVNPDGVAKATYIDNALRDWQFKQAKTLGFKNLDAMNKQTQISKFIIDKLGDQLVGKNGLNSMGLTDWIMLSGGDPTSVAAFLTKKFFSGAGVQSKIAEILSQNAEAVGAIVPEIGPSSVLRLNAPAEGIPKIQNNIPIEMPSQRAIQSGTEIVPKSAKQTKPQGKGK